MWLPVSWCKNRTSLKESIIHVYWGILKLYLLYHMISGMRVLYSFCEGILNSYVWLAVFLFGTQKMNVFVKVKIKVVLFNFFGGLKFYQEFVFNTYVASHYLSWTSSPSCCPYCLSKPSLTYSFDNSLLPAAMHVEPADQCDKGIVFAFPYFSKMWMMFQPDIPVVYLVFVANTNCLFFCFK